MAELLVRVARRDSRRDAVVRRRYAFEASVKSEWGRAGFSALVTDRGGTGQRLAASGDYVNAQAMFASAFAESLGRPHSTGRSTSIDQAMLRLHLSPMTEEAAESGWAGREVAR